MLSLVYRTLAHYHRLLIPVALGVAVASAVIVGALLIGDSMRGSLKHIAMDRIGLIQRFLIAPRWFKESAIPQFNRDSNQHGLMLIQSVVAEYQSQTPEEQGKISTHRVTEMTLFGIDPSFWKLGTLQPEKQLRGQSIILNQSLAKELKVVVGDRITLKVSRDAVVPADSALGKRENEVVALSRWEVIEILPDESLGRFSLKSDQRPVLNAFASKSELQKALDLEDKINAVVSGTRSNDSILDSLSLDLSDLGLRWTTVSRVFPDPALGELGDTKKIVYEYDQLSSDQMMLPDPLVSAMSSASQPTSILSYLANHTEVVREKRTDEKGRGVPYSIIAGVPWDLMETMLKESAGGQVPSPGQSLGDDWVVINQWMATELDAKVGDVLKIDYYLPETVEGTEVEQSFDATVVAIAPLPEPSEPYRRKKPAIYKQSPTAFNDAAWTPLVPGITDQESISSWETPFPLTREISKRDDEYWNAFRLTPKLFISDARAKLLFGSRFGSQTSLRFDGLSDQRRQETGDTILRTARSTLPALGWRDIPLRDQQMKAASGTTPFDALFLSLSFFVIAAALLLVALLFRLTIEKRADHWGLLLSSGWTRSKVRKLLLLESFFVASIGSAIGVVLGVFYAYGLLSGLKSWWIGAISVSFLEFYLRPGTLWIGWFSGLLISLATTWLVSRQLSRSSVAKLLKGRMEDESPGKQSSRWLRYGSVICIILWFLALAAGNSAQGQAQAGAFVASGMLWMIALLMLLYSRMGQGGSDRTEANVDVLRLAQSNAQRAPLRSILTVALMAMASFLILAMSLFQSQPDRRGTGGFAWIAKSSQSVHVNVSDPKQQRQILGDASQSLQDSMIVSVRVRGGDDASCNNLYQASEPQVMGIGASIKEVDQDSAGKSEFAWFATDMKSSPWERIRTPAKGTKADPLPVIIDQNTALWALHLGGYVGEQFHYQFGENTVYFKTVGVLQNTVLQGSLWISEDNFQKVFPEIGGYKYFLIKPKEDVSIERISEAKEAFERGWADEGMSCASAEGVLSRLLAVQNTYLSAFQLLGGIGLLLGTLGLGVSQLRSALERQSELAAMRAMGFPKNRLVWTLFLENGMQLFRGLGIGLFCALAASAPVLLKGSSVVSIGNPLCMLLFVIVVGLCFCVIAAKLAMRQPLLGSLRADR